MLSGSQISLDASVEPLSVGDSVYVGTGKDRIGTVAFIGETQFASGEWIGVILSSPIGKNDGSVSGISYFKCKPMHGIFSKRHNVRLVKGVVDKIASGEDAAELPVRPPPVVGVPTDSNCSGTSLVDNATTSLHMPPGSSGFQIGDRVQVSGGRTGVLRFLGPTEFAAGEWAGIELDEPVGKNDGSVSGKRYFVCKPNFGLFSLASKLHPPGFTLGSSTPQHRRSQESLVSFSSNLSSVSRSYRAQHGLSGNSALSGRTTTPNIRRPTSAVNSNSREQQANIQSLQRLIKEKEDHISQLHQEREIERSDLARATLERELAESEILNQRSQIEKLNQQLQSMEAAHQLLQDECEQLTFRLHEEKKNLEDLQFRMEEENINKATLEPRNVDEDSRIFELEEALMNAREINEQTEAELTRVRTELITLQAVQSKKSSLCIATEANSSSIDTEEQGDRQTAQSGECEPQFRDAKVGSPNKLPLHRVNLVAQASVAPAQINADSTVQAECERLRRELADRERVTESALKRQADVLQVVTEDFQKQIADLNAQVLASSKELVTSRQECNIMKEQSQVTITELQDEIHQLKSKFTEEENKYKETLSCYQKRIESLTAQLDSEKGKTSTTVMEQSVALRKLEEKLKLTERQLLDYQESVLLSAQQSVHNQIEQVSELSDDTCPVLDKPALLEQLKRQQAAYEEQLARLKEVESERNAALEAQRGSADRIQQLEAELALTREELLSSGSKQEELRNQLHTIRETRDKVLTDLSQLLNELPAVPDANANAERDLAQELRVRIGLLEKHVAEAEAHRDMLKSQVHTLQHERTALERELTLLNASQASHDMQQDLNAILEKLECSNQKMASLEASSAAALKDLENKSIELEKVQKSLDETLLERDQLQQAHQQTMAMLETERRQLQERIRAAESGVPMQPSSQNDKLARLTEEKNSAESQVAFLNSIIVDLHEKNRELEERVRNMLVLGETVNRHVNPAVVSLRPPRRWCDNCLIFDSHETEDCPNKPSHIGNGFKSRRKLSALIDQKPSTRIYCDICGVFDKHTTEDCTDTQTF